MSYYKYCMREVLDNNIPDCPTGQSAIKTP